MKKTFLSFLIMAGLMMAALPMVKAENKLLLPDGTIGISEKTYNELISSKCTGYNSQALGTQYTCPNLATSLLNKVVIRAEHSGEMYKVGYLPDPSGNFATVVLKPYLPDGFYNADGKYYWISNNVKLRLKKNNTFGTLLSGVKCDDTYCMAYTGISKENFETMVINCDAYAENSNTDAQYQECMAKYIQGEDLRWKLRGKVILQAYGKGKLYYISNNDFNTVYKLGNTINKKSFYKFVKKQAIGVDSQLIKQISDI